MRPGDWLFWKDGLIFSSSNMMGQLQKRSRQNLIILYWRDDTEWVPWSKKDYGMTDKWINLQYCSFGSWVLKRKKAMLWEHLILPYSDAQVKYIYLYIYCSWKCHCCYWFYCWQSCCANHKMNVEHLVGWYACIVCKLYCFWQYSKQAPRFRMPSIHLVILLLFK